MIGFQGSKYRRNEFSQKKNRPQPLVLKNETNVEVETTVSWGPLDSGLES